MPLKLEYGDHPCVTINNERERDYYGIRNKSLGGEADITIM
jgi:hypothetical protein